MTQNAMIVTPLSIGFDCDAGEKGGRNARATIESMKHAGFVAAATREAALSPKIEAASQRWLELSDDVRDILKVNTSGGVKYVPHSRFIPPSGQYLCDAVIEQASIATKLDVFNGMEVGSYQRIYGDAYVNEWMLVGYVGESGEPDRRTFLLAYWTEEGQNVPTLNMLKVLHQEQQSRELVGRTRTNAARRYEVLKSQSSMHFWAIAYVWRWPVVIGWPAMCGGMFALLPAAPGVSVALLGLYVVLALLAFMGCAIEGSAVPFAYLRAELNRYRGMPSKARIKVSDFPKPDRREIMSARATLSR